MSDLSLINFNRRQNYRRKTYTTQNKIKLQLHQPIEFAEMMMDSNYNKYTTSMILEAGNEYFIDVTPKGQMSTEGFKNLNFLQRQCHLETEVTTSASSNEESSSFKIYTKNNCKYECYVNLAHEHCHCIPWDYLKNNIQEVQECDIFGRNCFFDKMENLTKSSENPCDHCVEGCDYIHYNKEIVKQEKIVSADEKTDWRYLSHLNGEKCFGTHRAMCDIVKDVNNTFKVVMDRLTVLRFGEFHWGMFK